MKRVLLIGAGVLLLAAAAFAVLAIWALGAPDFPTPSGPHPVGTLELALVDSDRAETLGAQPGSPRQVGVRVWYPADSDAEGARLPIMDGRLSKAFGDLYGMPLGDEDGPPSAAIIDAAPLADGDRLPVVLFSHGGFAHRDQNLSTMQELASHGFIAVAIGHTHEAMLSLLPEGRSVGMDPRLAEGIGAFNAGDEEIEAEYLSTLDRMRDAAGRDEGIAAARQLGQVMTRMLEPVGHTPAELLDIRLGDIAFVLAQLRELDDDPAHPLHGRYDLARVGVLGHSLGAHAAISACLDSTIPVQACIALDTGYYLLHDDPVPPIERPVLFAYAEATRLPTGTEVSMAGTERFLSHGATRPPMTVVVEGTTHMNFSDMGYMPRGLRLLGALGPIDGGRAGAIVNDLTVSFFGRHLRGEGQSWLDAPAERYGEVHQ